MRPPHADSYAHEARVFLEQLCDALDRSKRTSEPFEKPIFRRFLHGTAPIAIGMTLAGCTGSASAPHHHRPPANVAEICDNGVDDNHNGLVDCRDSQCSDAPVCTMVVLYGAPGDFPDVPGSTPKPDPVPNTNPDAKLDSQSDLSMKSDPARPDSSAAPVSPKPFDCNDPKFARHPMCVGVLYAGPPALPDPVPPKKKRDSSDNDNSGYVPDFDSRPIALYAAPPGRR